MYLCNVIHEVEWSGVLMYTIQKGELGDGDFTIFADHLFLQDIGTQAYTEYDFGSKEFIKYMMTNKPVLAMRKGHIHSHNNMGVFFSGTDNSEIITNSEFHNYYLSLIINNKNEMMAKIASRSKTSSKTSTTFQYRVTDGSYRTGTTETAIEEEIVLAYTAEIEKPKIVNDHITDQITNIVKNKADKAAADKIAAENAKKLTPSKSWVQPTFDGFGKGSKKYSDRLQDYDYWSDGQKDRDGKVIDELFEDIDYPFSKSKPAIVNDEIIPWPGLVHVDQIKDLLIDIILKEQDHKISDILDALKIADKGLTTSKSVKKYAKDLADITSEYYTYSFKEDNKLEGYQICLLTMCEMLEAYKEDYAWVVNPLLDTFQQEYATL